jgi:hypothetical protein
MHDPSLCIVGARVQSPSSPPGFFVVVVVLYTNDVWYNFSNLALDVWTEFCSS